MTAKTCSGWFRNSALFFSTVNPFRSSEKRMVPSAVRPVPAPVAETGGEHAGSSVARGEGRQAIRTDWKLGTVLFKSTLFLCLSVWIGLSLGVWNVYRERQLFEMGLRIQLVEQERREALSRQRVAEARLAVMCAFQLVQQMSENRARPVHVRHRR